MATQTVILSQEVVNAGSMRAAPVTGKFDATQLGPHILFAEKKEIIPVITKPVWDKLREVRNPLPSNYNTDFGPEVKAFPNNPEFETFWLAHLQDICALAVLIKALPFISVKVSTTGVQLVHGHNSENAGIKGVSYLQDLIRERLMDMVTETRQYLCDNATDFPEFDASLCDKCGSGDGVDKDFGIIFY